MNSESTTARVAIDTIRVADGHNPRKAFRKTPMEELVKSIKAEGLIQPPAVRPDHDAGEGYILIAGERRLRACREAGMIEIPVNIIDCDEATAARHALTENLVRADLSPAEEAIAARDVLDLCGGDVRAAAAQLNWPESRMRARMLLLACSPDVLQAVAEGTVLVGHAELLSGLPHALQDKALPRLIERDTTVEQLREQIRGVVIPLSSAIFDVTAKCNGCIHNTATQGALFDSALSGANCQNRTCFHALTREALDAKRAELAEDVGTVAFTSEKDPDTYTPLLVTGEGGVGEAQFAQCRGCTHFGAIIHDEMNADAGRVDRPTCFDLKCNKAKVREHADTTAAANHQTEGNAASPNDTKNKGTVKKGAAKKKAPTTAKHAAPAASSTALRAAMKPAYLAAGAEVIATDTRAPLAIATYAMHYMLKEATGHSPLLDSKVIGQTVNPEEAIATLFAKDEADLLSLFRACATALAGGQAKSESGYSRNGVHPQVIAARLAQAAGVDLAKHFTFGADYLAASTREGINALLDESGHTAWLHAREDGEAQAKALKGMKKDDMVKAAVDSGFDFKGFVPKAMKSIKPRDFVGI